MADFRTQGRYLKSPLMGEFGLRKDNGEGSNLYRELRIYYFEN